jgi:hypothetical protein
MEFDFNTFFGYETLLNKKPDRMLIISFLLPVGLLLLSLFINFLLEKWHWKSYLIKVVLYTSFLLIFFGGFTISLLYFMGVSGVKLAYCYSIITIGMFFFCLLNGKTITKMILEQESSS